MMNTKLSSRTRLTTALLIIVIGTIADRYVSASPAFRIWGVTPVPRKSLLSVTSIRGGNKDELTLDEKVHKAMKKLGISSNAGEGIDSARESEECKDGVCPLPTAGQTKPPKTENLSEGDAYDLANKIAQDLNVHESLAMAALGATSAPVESNPAERCYDEKAARDLIQQEMNLIKNVSEDSQEVKQLISEGYDPFLSRRALAFAEMNMEDARAILIADEMDEGEPQSAENEVESHKYKPEFDQTTSTDPIPEKETKSNDEFKTVTVDAAFDPTKLGAAPAPTKPAQSNPPDGVPKPAKKEDVIFEATTAQIQELVIESPVPVLLDIYADWCGPCKVLGPVLEEMAIKAGGIFRLVKVNSDNERPISGALEVTALPTVFGIKDGRIVHMFQGMPKSQEFMKNFMMGLLMPAGTAAFDPPVTESEKDKYNTLSKKLAKTVAAASFSFAAREQLQDRISTRLDDLVNAYEGDLVDAQESVKILRSLISNVIKDPYQPKFRKINLKNKVISEKITQFSSSISILKCVGFVSESDGQSMVIGKGKQVVNVAPLVVARDFLDKWIDKKRYEVAASARKRKDEADRQRLEAEAAAAGEDEDNEEEEEEEERDPSSCELRVRLDGKKKVHEILLNANDPLSKIIASIPLDVHEEDVQLTCVARRLIVKSTDTAAMSKSIQEHGLMPKASIVVKVGGKNAAQNSPSRLSERAAVQKNRKKGSHTMQSVGIYSKDDNAKAELIDGGGGVWYEHDVTDDEDEVADPETNSEENPEVKDDTKEVEEQE